MYAPLILDPAADTPTSATPDYLDAAGEQQIHCEEIHPDAHPLAEHFYRANGYKIRCGRQERLFVVCAGGEMIAAARLLPRQDGFWWLRNMLVAKAKRNAGIGAYFMREILARITPGVCYCFALPQAVDFYQRAGFIAGAPTPFPADIAAEYRRYKSRGRDWVLMFANSTAYTTRAC